ncbi:MAG: hypothetical protein [Ninurtavirus cruti]|uniref:Transmembrane protein n=1 Tax=Cressdnaviricota sp. TaxID=2748378 RepID=A0A3G2YTB6_9VIRU|nr:MAG: hypothetical protein [Cressdnaviricota sp.]
MMVPFHLDLWLLVYYQIIAMVVMVQLLIQLLIQIFTLLKPINQVLLMVDKDLLVVQLLKVLICKCLIFIVLLIGNFSINQLHLVMKRLKIFMFHLLAIHLLVVPFPLEVLTLPIVFILKICK